MSSLNEIICFVSRVLIDIETNFKDICETMLHQLDTNEYLNSIKLILKSIENSSILKNGTVYQLWTFIQTKLNEYLKQLNKNLSISSDQQTKVNNLDYEAVYIFLTFPFKHFLKFKLEHVSQFLPFTFYP